MMNNKKAVFPGSFDPFHLGHKFVLEQIIDLFDEIIITIPDNSEKSSLFNINQKIKIIKHSILDLQLKNNIQIIPCNGLLTDFMTNHNVNYIVRGARNIIDFQHEMFLMHNYQQFNNKIKYIIIPSKVEYISSSIIRNIIKSTNDYTNLKHFVSINAIDLFIK